MNFKITDEHIEKLRKIFPNLDDMLKMSLEDFMFALDDAMLETLDYRDGDCFSTKETAVLARVIDELAILNDNEEDSDEDNN